MLRKLRKKIKGQSTAEYAILIALVIAAVVAMQTFAKRALQARISDASRYLVQETSALGNTLQYEPYYLTSEFEVERESRSRQEVTGDTVLGARSNAQIQRKAGGFQRMAYNEDLDVGSGLEG